MFDLFTKKPIFVIFMPKRGFLLSENEYEKQKETNLAIIKEKIGKDYHVIVVPGTSEDFKFKLYGK